MRLFPQIMLSQATARSGTLRWVGNETVNGTRYDVISFVDAGNVPVSLYIDSTDRSLDLVEVIADDLLHGTAVQRLLYEDLHDSDYGPVPHAWRFTQNGVTLQERRATDMVFNPEIDAALFAQPEGKGLDGPPAILTPVPLAENVFLIHDWTGFGFNYNSLAVMLDDEVVLIEAPLADQLTSFQPQVLAAISGGRELKKVVATHYHHDHLGGINAYLNGEVTVLAPSDVASYIQDLAAVEHPISGTIEARQPLVQAIDGELRLAGTDVTLELFVVATPHVDQMVLAWVPEAGVLYVTDLFGTSAAGNTFEANPGGYFLRDWIEEKGLAVKTIAPAHGYPVAYEDFLAIYGTDLADADRD